MSDLIEFLRARLDEDEQIARGAGYHRWQLGIAFGTVLAVGNGKTVVRDCREYDAEHIARHDPARVLREVEAKRRILAEMERWTHHFSDDSYESCSQAPGSQRTGSCDCGLDEQRQAIRSLLALPYSDHPDYREEWKP